MSELFPPPKSLAAIENYEDAAKLQRFSEYQYGKFVEDVKLYFKGLSKIYEGKKTDSEILKMAIKEAKKRWEGGKRRTLRRRRRTHRKRRHTSLKRK